MGGGAMWRTVSRVVGSTPTTAASNAAMCRMCTTTPALKAPTSARMACSCSSSEVHTPSNGQSNSGLQQYWEIDDWVFAGEDAESLDYLVFGTVPSKEDVEEATSDLQQALQIGLLMGKSSTSPLEPESRTSGEAVDTKGDREEAVYHVTHPGLDGDWKEPAAFEVASSSRSKEVVGAGGYGAMLEAFHQFQHNPQVQNMVVSLATDKSVWEAVLANDQIKEFRQKLRESTGLIEDGSELTVDEVSKALNEDSNLFSHVFWNTKRAFTQFMTTLQEFIRGIFDVAEEKLKINDDDDAFFERTVRSTMMLSVLVMSLVVFKKVGCSFLLIPYIFVDEILMGILQTFGLLMVKFTRLIYQMGGLVKVRSSTSWLVEGKRLFRSSCRYEESWREHWYIGPSDLRKGSFQFWKTFEKRWKTFRSVKLGSRSCIGSHWESCIFEISACSQIFLFVNFWDIFPCEWKLLITLNKAIIVVQMVELLFGYLTLSYCYHRCDQSFRNMLVYT